MQKLVKISKSFNKRRLWEPFDLSFEKGSKIAISGESGCGKSTLLKCLSGNQQFDNNVRCSMKSLYIDAGLNLFGDQPYVEYLEKINSTNENIELLLEKFSLPYDKEKKIKSLSFGEIKRVNIIGALISSAEILLFDEVDSSLNESLRKTFVNLVKSSSKTIIIVSHNEDVYTEFENRISYSNLKPEYTFKSNYKNETVIDNKLHQLVNANIHKKMMVMLPTFIMLVLSLILSLNPFYYKSYNDYQDNSYLGTTLSFYQPTFHPTWVSKDDMHLVWEDWSKYEIEDLLIPKEKLFNTGTKIFSEEPIVDNWLKNEKTAISNKVIDYELDVVDYINKDESINFASLYQLSLISPSSPTFLTQIGSREIVDKFTITSARYQSEEKYKEEKLKDSYTVRPHTNVLEGHPINTLNYFEFKPNMSSLITAGNNKFETLYTNDTDCNQYICIDITLSGVINKLWNEFNLGNQQTLDKYLNNPSDYANEIINISKNTIDSIEFYNYLWYDLNVLADENSVTSALLKYNKPFKIKRIINNKDTINVIPDLMISYNRELVFDLLNNNKLHYVEDEIASYENYFTAWNKLKNDPNVKNFQHRSSYQNDFLFEFTYQRPNGIYTHRDYDGIKQNLYLQDKPGDGLINPTYIFNLKNNYYNNIVRVNENVFDISRKHYNEETFKTYPRSSDKNIFSNYWTGFNRDNSVNNNDDVTKFPTLSGYQNSLNVYMDDYYVKSIIINDAINISAMIGLILFIPLLVVIMVLQYKTHDQFKKYNYYIKNILDKNKYQAIYKKQILSIIVAILFTLIAGTILYLYSGGKHQAINTISMISFALMLIALVVTIKDKQCSKINFESDK